MQSNIKLGKQFLVVFELGRSYENDKVLENYNDFYRVLFNVFGSC